MCSLVMSLCLHDLPVKLIIAIQLTLVYTWFLDGNSYINFCSHLQYRFNAISHLQVVATLASVSSNARECKWKCSSVQVTTFTSIIITTASTQQNYANICHTHFINYSISSCYFNTSFTCSILSRNEKRLNLKVNICNCIIAIVTKLQLIHINFVAMCLTNEKMRMFNHRL